MTVATLIMICIIAFTLGSLGRSFVKGFRKDRAKRAINTGGHTNA
jgi:hypothetical protein